MTGKPDLARKILEGVIAQAPEHLPALQRLAHLALDQNRLDDALATLETILKKHPNDLEGLKLHGRANLVQRKTDEALKDLDAVVKARPEDAQARYLLGLACIQAGDIGQAKANLKEATTLDPNATGAILHLAELNILTGASRSATDELLRLLQKTPKNFEALVLLADAASTPQGDCRRPPAPARTPARL